MKIAINNHGSAGLIVAMGFVTLTALYTSVLVRSQASAFRRQTADHAKVAGYFMNELGAWHAKVVQGSGTVVPQDNPMVFNRQTNLKYWTHNSPTDTEVCGSSNSPGASTKLCLVERDPCKLKGLKKTAMSKQLVFQEHRTSCKWGQDGNFPQINNITTARYEDPALSIDIPSDGYLCSLDFDVDESKFWFADGVMLTFNDIILIGSDNWTERYGSYKGNPDPLIYDWGRKMKGKMVVLGPDEKAGGKFRNGIGTCPKSASGAITAPECSTYCIGQNNGSRSSVCHMPSKSDNFANAIQGQFQLTIRDPNIFWQLGSIARQQQRAEFRLITYGDDNQGDDGNFSATSPGDCWHGKLPVTVRYTYVDLSNE